MLPPAHSPLPVPATVPPLIFFQLHSPPISQPSLAYPPTASQHYALFPKSFANLTLRMTSNTMWFIFQTKNYKKKTKTKNNKQKPKSLAAGPANLLAAMSTAWRRDYNIGCCTLQFCWYLASVELQWWLHGAYFYAPEPRNDETQQRHSWVLLDISNIHPYHFSPQWNAHQLSQPLCQLCIPWSSQRLCLPLSIVFEAFPFCSGNGLEPVKELLATV